MVLKTKYPFQRNTSIKPFYNFFKRGFDFIFAIIGVIFFSPVLLIVSFLVKTSSPGPVFYRGIRTGRFGQQFKIFKFRSMLLGSDLKAYTTSRNDSRVTRVGKIIRRYKVDELPQLINVIKGEMSFVGPRPELPYYTDQYREDELLILSVRPGITDLSSIKFSNLNDLIDDDYPDKNFEKNILEEKNRLRIYYVKEQNFLLDIRLILKTILRLKQL